MVVTLLAGAIVSAMVTPFLPSTGQHPVLVTVVVVHVLLVGAAIFFLLEFGRTTDQRLREIQEGIGTAAELIAKPAKDSKGEYFDRLRSIIDSTVAGDEVLILTYHARGSGGDGSAPTPAYVKARKRYFDTLLRKAREGVAYRRILTFEDLGSNEAVRISLVRDHIIQHCREMLHLHEQRSGTVTVKRAPAYVMADLFILNRANGEDVGAFSLETYAQRERMYTAGALIVHDPPNGLMLDQFRQWWDEADGNSSYVDPSELHATSGAA